MASKVKVGCLRKSSKFLYMLIVVVFPVINLKINKAIEFKNKLKYK